MQRGKKHMFETYKLSPYDLNTSVNERYSLQMNISNIIVQNLVVEIVKDIDSMNDIICIGVEGQNEGRNGRKGSKRREREKWICF